MNDPAPNIMTNDAPFLAAYDDLDATIDSLDLPEEQEEELRRHIARVLTTVSHKS